MMDSQPHLRIHSAAHSKCVYIYCYMRSFQTSTLAHVRMLALCAGRHIAIKHHRLLEQPIPRSFLKLQYRVREIATKLKTERRPPVMRETLFR